MQKWSKSGLYLVVFNNYLPYAIPIVNLLNNCHEKNHFIFNSITFFGLREERKYRETCGGFKNKG